MTSHLEHDLRNRIKMHGPLTIAEFMGEALGHSRYGYYTTRDPLGSKGDFITSPEISQLFGEIIGIWCAYQWQQLGMPQPVHLVELGPGRGTLMADILRATRHVAGLHQALEVHLVETSPVLRNRQQELLAESACRVHWHRDIETLPKETCIIVANEFFDALPIHQYQRLADGWHEIMVMLDPLSEQLSFGLSARTPIEAQLFAQFPDTPPQGVVEISPASLHIMKALSLQLAQHGGAMAIIDYGYTHADYDYKGTLQAVKEHRYHPVLRDPGEADITAHVDFSALTDIASEVRLSVLPLLTQGEFLQHYGIEIRLRELLKHASHEAQAMLFSAFNRLTSPDQMGSLFRVFTCYHGLS